MSGHRPLTGRRRRPQKERMCPERARTFCSVLCCFSPQARTPETPGASLPQCSAHTALHRAGHAGVSVERLFPGQLQRKVKGLT